MTVTTLAPVAPDTDVDLKPSDLIDLGVQALGECGWITGQLGSKDFGFCTLGALRYAGGIPTTEMMEDDWNDWQDLNPVKAGRYTRTQRFLEEELSKLPEMDNAFSHSVPEWNDHAVGKLFRGLRPGPPSREGIEDWVQHVEEFDQVRAKYVTDTLTTIAARLRERGE